MADIDIRTGEYAVVLSHNPGKVTAIVHVCEQGPAGYGLRQMAEFTTTNTGAALAEARRVIDIKERTR